MKSFREFYRHMMEVRKTHVAQTPVGSTQILQEAFFVSLC